MADFSNQMQLQMQEYQNKIVVLEKQLKMWRAVQSALLDNDIKLVDKRGAIMTHDDAGHFVITNTDDSEIWWGDEWGSALKMMGVAL